MKKTLLALAITAVSVNAFAVNLDTPATPGTQVFASEITVAAAGTTIGNAVIQADVKAGFALATGGYVRFDLSNGAKFEGVPTLVDATPVVGEYTVSSGGAGANFVIFNYTSANTASEALTLKTAGAVAPAIAGLKVVNSSPVSVEFGLYESAGAAATKTGNLNTKTGTLVSFAPALKITATTGAVLPIDAIASASKKFQGPLLVSPVATYASAVTAGLLKIDGSAAAYADIIASEAWKLSGNFSAAATGGISGGTLAADKLSATYAAAPGAVTYTVTGTDDIAETSVSALYTPVVNAGYTVSPVTLNNTAIFALNGTNQAVDLALKPGGTFTNYVRISNTDTIPGAINVKVINDAGQSVSFPLSSVAGQPASLGAGASTTQITIQQIFDAATAQGLALSGEGKLRLVVNSKTNKLSVQSYTVALDGNSFSTF